MKKLLPFLLPSSIIIAVIALSNALVAIPIGPWLTAGAFTFPLTFLVNDITNRHYGAQHTRKIIYISLLPAFLISLAAASPSIAVASLLAFLCSQTLDITIFDRLRQQKWWRAPLISTLCSSIIDTTLFYGLAFGGSGNPWLQWAIGDQAVKWASAFIMLIPFWLFKGYIAASYSEK